MRSEARVVITGAAHGIGAALSECLAARSCRVAVLDLDGAAARTRAAALESNGARVLSVACDVTASDQCARAVDRVCEAWGGIDLLVNNAGITQLGRIRDTEDRVLRRVLEVNFFGSAQMTRAALPSLLANRGRVAVLSSVAGFAPLATRAGYSASKHAIEGWFATLRTEHARDGLGVTIVRPSFVRTGIGSRALGAREGDRSPGRTGVGRELEPAAAAEAIVRGIERGNRIVWVGREARLSWWVWQHLPGLYERLMTRRTLD